MLGEFFIVVLDKMLLINQIFFIQIQVGRWTEDSGQGRRATEDDGIEYIVKD